MSVNGPRRISQSEDRAIKINLVRRGFPKKLGRITPNRNGVAAIRRKINGDISYSLLQLSKCLRSSPRSLFERFDSKEKSIIPGINRMKVNCRYS